MAALSAPATAMEGPARLADQGVFEAATEVGALATATPAMAAVRRPTSEALASTCNRVRTSLLASLWVRCCAVGATRSHTRLTFSMGSRCEEAGAAQ